MISLGEPPAAELSRWASSRRWWQILPVLVTLVACTPEQQSDAPKVVTFSTPSGEVSYREHKDPDGDSYEPIVEALSDSEMKALQTDALRAQALIDRYVPTQMQTGNVLADLDSAFSSWLLSEDRTKYPEEDIARIIGSSIGTKAVDTLGVRWVRITDVHGSSIALRLDDPEIHSFPIEAVKYRIEDRTTGFVSAFYEVLKKTIQDRRKG